MNGVGAKGQRAYELFLQGYNCAQSVVGAFADEMGLPLETAMRVASGFGGGIGRLRETCGTVSGMVLVAGMLRGYGAPETGARKTQTYAMVQELCARFRAANGTIVCRELLGLSAPEGTPQAEARTPEYYQKRPCPRLAAEAADILAAYLAETAGAWEAAHAQTAARCETDSAQTVTECEATPAQAMTQCEADPAQTAIKCGVAHAQTTARPEAAPAETTTNGCR